MTISIASCTGNTVVTDSWCGIDSIITVSKDDHLTTATEKEIYLHNEQFGSKCNTSKHGVVYRWMHH